MISISQDELGTTLILKPNQSASWRHIKTMLMALGGLTLAIAAFLASQGAWVVLPFAGLEVLLLSYFVYRVNQGVHKQQVLKLSDETITLQSGKNSPEQQWRFKRSEARFHIERPTHSLSTEKIFLEDEEQSEPLGDFLNIEDMKQLMDWLRHSGLPTQYSGETRTVAKDFFEP